MRQQPSRVSRAFTIAELMIVLIILGVVLAVVLPSLKHVSARAKAAVSTTIMGSVGSAAGQFANDNNGRNPGYFTAAQMGNAANAGLGMPAMANVLLDLMPGVTQKPASDATQVYKIGPTTTDEVNIDLTQFGGSTVALPGGSAKSYFRPDPKYFYAVAEAGGTPTNPNAQVSSTPGHRYMPNLHDAYGTPILAWQQDDRVAAAFALNDTSAGTVAQFYLVSNQCFLNATSTGKLQTNQQANSMLGGAGDTGPQGRRTTTLEGMLGNPAFPGKARGPIVFHSAGANGVFLGTDERGAKTSLASGNTPGPLQYIPGLDPMKNGDFDDIIISAGN